MQDHNSHPAYSCAATAVQVDLWEVFFFNDTATTEIYTLSLHDALPISLVSTRPEVIPADASSACVWARVRRSEEHTSELQSHLNLVCRLLLEKKNLRLLWSQLPQRHGCDDERHRPDARNRLSRSSGSVL